MADLTLNFADASFDQNDDNDFLIEPGNSFIYEMGNSGNKVDTGITSGASITGAAFTIAHNQNFVFEFEDDGDPLTTDDYELTVFTEVTEGSEFVPPVVTEDTVSWDVAQTNMDGAVGPDGLSSPTLVDGRSAKVTVTRLDEYYPSNLAEAETEIFYVGDGEQAGYTSWVLSGDMNGTAGNNTSGDGTLGFNPGHYGGVFLGGDGTDTLVFENYDPMDNAQMYVGLDAGFAMFGNGASSPLVQFATIGSQPYQLDWERLEMRGDSNDFVVVGGGLQGTDASAAARELDTSDFFQIDLGSGDDTLYVTDSSQSITLDLSATGEHYVTADSSGNDFTLDVSGNEMHDGYAGDNSSLKVKGSLDHSSNPTSAVIDYIDFGDGENNFVINNSEMGLAVNFGTASDASGSADSTMGQDEFIGSDRTKSDLIDLRGIDGELSIFDQTGDASGSIIDIDVSGTDVEIQATNVDLLYVSQLDASGNATSDSDVLVNAEALYGSTGVLGKKMEDVDGAGYDVITSAKLESWEYQGSKQIFYDGDHSDFLDSGDELDRDASDYTVSTVSVATTGPGSEQLSWNDQIEAAQANASTPQGSATPSFYIIDGPTGKKVPVYLDETDPTAPQWKVDTSEFEVTSDAGSSFTSSLPATGNGSVADLAAKIGKDFGVTVTGADLMAAKSVYLNGSHDDIVSLLGLSDGTGVQSLAMDAAYDFGFYTQVNGTKTGPGGTENVAVNVALNHQHDGYADTWTLSPDDVHVQTSYNTVTTAQNAAVGGTGGDFVEMGNGSGNVAMGNAGNDAYIVGDGDAGVINELGALMGGGISEDDSVQFELVNSVAELDFSRIQIAGEIDGSTLKITASGNKGEALLFDQYNDFLSFRKTEYLVIDDGATSNEVFELVTGDATDTYSSSYNSWDNEIYVAHSGEDINVKLGGIDHVFLGDGDANKVTIDLNDILSSTDSGSVSVTGIEGDTLNVIGGTESDRNEVTTAYDTVKSVADKAEISWDGTGKFFIDVYNDSNVKVLDEDISLYST